MPHDGTIIADKCHMMAKLLLTDVIWWKYYWWQMPHDGKITAEMLHDGKIITNRCHMMTKLLLRCHMMTKLQPRCHMMAKLLLTDATWWQNYCRQMPHDGKNNCRQLTPHDGKIIADIHCMPHDGKIAADITLTLNKNAINMNDQKLSAFWHIEICFLRQFVFSNNWKSEPFVFCLLFRFLH